jgi:hypothetical protein
MTRALAVVGKNIKNAAMGKIYSITMVIQKFPIPFFPHMI